MRLPAKYLDLLIAVLLFVTAFLYAGAGLRQTGLGIFYQEAFGPAIALACRGEFDNLVPTQEIAVFLGAKAGAIDCADVPPTLGSTKFTPFQYQTLYLIGAVGLVWKIAGVSWHGAVVIAQILAAALAVALYAFARLFVPSWLAAVATAMVIVSPSSRESPASRRPACLWRSFCLPFLPISQPAAHCSSMHATFSIWGSYLGCFSPFRRPRSSRRSEAGRGAVSP
jgi:hypothetical protein